MKNKKIKESLLMIVLSLGLLTGCGQQGERGEQGDRGSDGLNGSNGKDGIDGEDGKDGLDGSTILTGNGEPSIALGEDGDSYINLDTWDYYVKKDGLWVKSGNLKGTNGKDGENGKDGDDGVSVVSIEKTSSDGGRDTYTITYSDGTESTFTVTNGEDGEQGIQGEKGDDGHTPSITIGENGNWYVDGVDSGVSSKGERGNDGEKGDKGEDGVSIVNAYVDENGHLICEMSDGTKKDAGKVKETSKHQVNFYLKGRLLETIEVANGLKISAPSPEKTKGYHIYYWYTKEESSSYHIPWSFTGCTVTSDLNIYADSDLLGYTLTYDFDGLTDVENPNPTIYDVEQTIILEDAVKKGYTFRGWYTDSSFENQITQISKGSTGNVSLYGKLIADKNILTVTSSDLTKGTAEIVSGEGYTDEEITIKATPADGYVFAGWYEGTEEISVSEEYTFTMPASDKSIVARFMNEDEYSGKTTAS